MTFVRYLGRVPMGLVRVAFRVQLGRAMMHWLCSRSGGRGRAVAAVTA